MLTGFDRLIQLGGTADAVIPGHDPLVRDLFPAYGHSGFVWQLHQKLIKPLPSF